MLADRLDSINTDNGANFVAAVRKLVDKGVVEEQVRCACHTLQLSIKKGLEAKDSATAALVQVFHLLVKFITTTTLAAEQLRVHQLKLNAAADPEPLIPFAEDNIAAAHVADADADKAEAAADGAGSVGDQEDDIIYDAFADSDVADSEQLQPDSQQPAIPPQSGTAHMRALKLVKENKTRWNSTYWSVSRCVQLQESICATLKDLNRNDLVPTEEQWDEARKLCSMLEIFQIATDLMQGEKYPTLGLVSRAITVLMNGLWADCPPAHWRVDVDRWDDAPPAVKQLRQCISADMQQRWDPGNLLLGMAAIVNPAYKDLDWLDPEQQDAIADQLLAEALVVAGLDPDQSDDDSDPVPEAPAPSNASDDSDPAPRLFGARPSAKKQRLSPRQAVAAEVKAYLAQEVDVSAMANKGDAALGWWKVNQGRFPHISKLALKYLAIPASTAPSERVFSVAKNIISRKRWRLTPERFNECIFLKHNSEFISC
jgi:hypothetical protein